MEATSDIVRTFYARKGNRGEIINVDDSSALIAARTGYYNSWGERQILLQILYDNIKNPNKILTNKNIVNVVDAHDCVTATCEDGTSYEADILVGCDGVNSQIRQKIWELAEEEHPRQVRQDKAGKQEFHRCSIEEQLLTLSQPCTPTTAASLALLTISPHLPRATLTPSTGQAASS